MSKTIVAHPNGLFIVSLPINRSTGYHWDVIKKSDELRLVSTLKTSPNNNLIGSPSEQVWLWKVSSRVSRDKLSLIYGLFPPGQTNPVEEEYFRIKVEYYN